jgi:hypothetical protein
MSEWRNLSISAWLLFAAPSALAADVPTPLGEPATTEGARADREYEEAILAIRQAMFPAGERVENWNVGGADVEKAIRARGADKYYLLESDSSAGSTLVSIFTERPIADFAPPTWRVAASFGTAETPLANPSVTFGFLTPRFVMAGRADGRRSGDSDCSDKIGHAILYEVPGAPRSPEDEDMPDLMAGMMLAMEGQTVCSRYDGSPEEGYSVRNFLPDGRLLLNPDRSVPAARAAIVPAAPVDSLIKPPPPTPATQP